MHNHGNQGRKFGRERDQRTALIKGLATSLVTQGHIETTVHKAKEVVPYVEDLITKAKKGDLAARRMILSGLSTVVAAHKLVDDIAPKLSARTSGHLRIKQTRLRVGDNAQMAEVTFVDDITTVVAEEKPKKAAAKVPAKKPEAK
jgi:large subunit ribosomal protein L17